MINETQQERAVDYLLGELDGPAAAQFEKALAADPELRAWVEGLQEAAAALPRAEPASPPPLKPLLRALDEVRSVRKIVRFPAVPWAIAAALAVCCSLLAMWDQRSRRDLAALQQKDSYSALRIATLSAQADAYAKAVAVVLWDDARQRGLLKLAQVPPPAAGLDYQLWVLDPSQTAPVSAGLVAVDGQGMGRTEFIPVRPVGGEEKFAISLEPAGGSAAPRGPVILVGQ